MVNLGAAAAAGGSVIYRCPMPRSNRHSSIVHSSERSVNVPRTQDKVKSIFSGSTFNPQLLQRLFVETDTRELMKTLHRFVN